MADYVADYVAVFVTLVAEFVTLMAYFVTLMAEFVTLMADYGGKCRPISTTSQFCRALHVALPVIRFER